MNRRNHPYFMNRSMPAPKSAAPVDLECAAPAPLPMYCPRMVDPKNPMWNHDDGVVNKLSFAFEDNNYNPELGYRIDGIGQVYEEYENLNAAPGVISALAIVSDNNDIEMAPAHILNTEDAGLRYVRFCKDGSVADLGPVEQTCLVGNVNRPEGLYVPMCNTKSMADGAHLLNNMIKEATIGDRDLPKIEKSVAKNLPAKTDDHKCSCGGSCKCGGKCGNNCKCKK